MGSVIDETDQTLPRLQRIFPSDPNLSRDNIHTHTPQHHLSESGLSGQHCWGRPVRGTIGSETANMLKRRCREGVWLCLAVSGSLKFKHWCHSILQQHAISVCFPTGQWARTHLRAAWGERCCPASDGPASTNTEPKPNHDGSVRDGLQMKIKIWNTHPSWKALLPDYVSNGISKCGHRRSWWPKRPLLPMNLFKLLISISDMVKINYDWLHIRQSLWSRSH